jgi:hypothetical protein
MLLACVGLESNFRIHRKAVQRLTRTLLTCARSKRRSEERCYRRALVFRLSKALTFPFSFSAPEGTESKPERCLCLNLAVSIRALPSLGSEEPFDNLARLLAVRVNLLQLGNVSRSSKELFDM